MSVSRSAKVLAILGTALLALSCSGGSDVAEITGSGSRQGDIEAFGSVFIAGERYSTADANIILDGNEGSDEGLLRVGMQAMVELRPGADRIIDRMNVSSRMVGQVDSFDQLRGLFSLLGQDVRVDDRTVLNCCDQNELNIGDTVRVFANEVDDGTLLASLVEAVASAEESVAGEVSDVDGSDLQVAGLTIDISALAARGAAVRVGERIWVSGSRDREVASDRLIADSLVTTELLRLPPGDRVELSGVISNYRALLNGRIVEFDMDGLPVRHLDGTDMLINKPEAGSQNGDRIVVTGFATNDGFVRAEVIHHVSPVEAELESHITGIDAEAGTVTLFGNVTAELGVQSQFIRAPVGGSRAYSFEDLQLGDRIELRLARVEQFASRDAMLSDAALEIARVTSIENESADNGAVNDLMVAPLEALDSAARQITVLGNVVTIDDNTEFDSHKNEEEFFASVQTGDVLEVELLNSGAQLIALEISVDGGEWNHDSELDD